LHSRKVFIIIYIGDRKSRILGFVIIVLVWGRTNRLSRRRRRR